MKNKCNILNTIKPCTYFLLSINKKNLITSYIWQVPTNCNILKSYTSYTYFILSSKITKNGWWSRWRYILHE